MQLLDANGLVKVNYIGGKDRAKYTTNGFNVYEDTICSLVEPLSIYWWLEDEGEYNTTVKLNYDIIVYNSDVLQEMSGFLHILEKMRNKISFLECDKEEMKNRVSLFSVIKKS